MAAQSLRRSLSGCWDFCIDPENIGRNGGWVSSLPAHKQQIEVPSVWNLTHPRYTGVAWYQKSVDIPEEWRGRTVQLVFHAVSLVAEVWCNDSYLGSFESGYLPFEIDLSKILQIGRMNRLTVRVLSPPLTTESHFFQYSRIEVGQPVDGLRLEEFPSAKQALYATFGGIWQEVELRVKPLVWIRDATIHTNLKRSEATVQLVLENHAQGSERGVLELSVLAATKDDAPGNGRKDEITLGPGRSMKCLSLPVTNVRPWSGEDPNLYRLVVRITTRHGEDQVIESFGFREFLIKNGAFYLNGGPVFLKGVLFQPFFPITIAYPEDQRILEKAVWQAKEAGFNLLRAHISPLLPRMLEACDSQGMMVYQEPAIGWIKDSAQMERRCLQAVSGLIARDKNHPSIIAWGMLNESGNYNYETGARRIVERLMQEAHAADPSRLVVDDSGGVHWSGQFSRYLNPYSHHCGSYLDVHPYHSVPLSPEWFNYFRKLGDPNGKANFLSEFGFGGLVNLEQHLRVYEQRGLTRLQDYECLRNVGNEVREGIRKYGLSELFPSVAAFCIACQDVQAQENSRIIEALRVNDKASGYCLTQFQDTSVEMGAGVVDYFYEPKKIFHSLPGVQRNVILVIVTDKDNYRAGEPVSCEIMLVNDAGIVGQFVLDFAVHDAQGVLWLQETVKVQVAGNRVQGLHKSVFSIAKDCGQYQFTARLCARSSSDPPAAWGKHVVRVFEEVTFATDTERVAVIDIHDAYKDLFSCCGIASADFCARGKEKLIVLPPLSNTLAAYPREKIAAALERARNGASLVVLELPLDLERHDDHPLSRTFDARKGVHAAEGIFLGAFHWYKNSRFFRGVGTGGLMDRAFSSVFPTTTLAGIGGEHWAGTFTMWPDLMWGTDLSAKPWGKGILLYCQLRLFNSLATDIVAKRLFKNILEFAAESAR